MAVLKRSKAQLQHQREWQASGNARHYERPYWRLYKRLCKRARDAKLPVELTYEQYVTIAESNPTCHYCGNKLIWTKHGDEHTHVNIDRKNNAKGYTKRNVVAACLRCNMSRGARWTYRQWKKMTGVIKK
jgi:5-methylcytosine-specific restriction endonuclease McrA